MGVAKYDYVMDYIEDKTLYKAVMFARQMIRDGEYPSHAIRKASKYYKRDMGDIAHYVGQCGSRRANEKRKDN